MKLEVYKKDGALSGREVELADSVFGIEPNTHVIYLAVKTQATNQRQGTVATKTRGLVSGGGKKPWKQKGRGTARSGSSRSPIWRGGGTAHGPQPVAYELKLPRKVKRLARISALSARVKDEAVKVLEDFTLEAVKTREMAQVLKAFNLAEAKTLILLPEYDASVLRASRNIANLKVQVATDASTTELLDCKALLIMESAIKKLEGSLQS
ncbi:MAG TPA: 50S ribosomal protein L4 [bacterium]|mgnify:CR=1 FL=1|nr:50S ribosomal protein L4 [bacterium]HPR88509.1 50S ribosomal protein L4 [bacterium]